MGIMTYYRFDLFPIPEAIFNIGGLKCDTNVAVNVALTKVYGFVRLTDL